MQNFKQPGCVLSLTAPYAVDSGDGAKVGAIFGVATGDVESGAAGEFATEGVFELTKVGSQAWSEGDRVYWNDSSKACSTVATVGMFIGVATAAVASGANDTTGTVKLVSAPELLEGNQGTVADVATADSDGTYGAAESTLINEMKTVINALLAKLRIQGLIS